MKRPPASLPLALLGAGLLCVGSTIGAGRVSAPPERAHSAFSEDPGRRFDFWIGRWDVNLRMLQDDLSFRDSVRADTHIYRILGGKAILELWDSDPIKGYSLRYHDPEKNAWVLWLDWPGKNRSRVSSLEGTFRHGRGDFHSTWTTPDGDEVRQRYSFNDITPFSLRWDDLSSRDDGKTWRKNWIMEFTRTAVDPPWPISRDAVPTFGDGGRCDARSFRPYEALEGSWEGKGGAALEVYRILDGCAVMGFLQDGGKKEFLFLTFDTGSERWEADVLDETPGAGLMRYFGGESWTDLVSSDGQPLRWTLDGDRLEYRRGTGQVSFTRR